MYNQETGLFEVETGVAGLVSRRIQSALHDSKSQFFTGDPTVLARTPPVDNNYSVSVSGQLLLSKVLVGHTVYLLFFRKLA